MEVLNGRLVNKDGEWWCKFVVKDGVFNFAMEALPLHPDDVSEAEHGKIVQFIVQTIATGTSEFDIMDCDVAKLVIINKQ
jgi:hypothetical protein